MSEENITGIPEEETTELPKEEVLQTTKEAVPASEEENADCPIEENDEEAEIPEDNDNEKPEKVINEEDLCPYCEENEKAEGSEYCTECEEKMLSRKIPFLAWVSGFAAVVFSVFALALVFILTAPSIQVAKADKYARENRWYSAYTEYSTVASVVDELTSILGGESPFVKTGTGLAVKKFDALAKYTSPLEAFYYEGTNVEFLEGKSNAIMENYFEIYDSYMSSYDIVLAALEEKFGQQTPEADEVHAVVEELRGTEGMSDIWVDYYHLSFAYNLNESDEVALEYLKAIDESAKKTDLDFSWLYYTEIADLLYRSEDYEGSAEFLDKLIKKDKTNFGAYELKMRILLKTKGLDDAKLLLDEFIEYNEGIDTAYVLETMYLRCSNELDKALELCNEALEEYGSAPELSRQLALIYLLKNDYDNAFESAFSAYSNAAYIAQYYQDNSSLTTQLYNTLYLCAYLESEKGSMTTEHSSEIGNILSDLKDFATTDSVLDVINGEKTLEEVLMEGDFDLI